MSVLRRFLSLFCAIILTGGLSHSAFGNHVVYDELVYEGKALSMVPTPLESFPHPPRLYDQLLMSSGSTQGYVGAWEIRNDSLWLLGLRIYGGKTYSLDSVLSRGHGPVFADWYSGTLHCPQGDMIRYVMGSFASVYERELLLQIENGLLIGRSVITNDSSSLYRGSLDLSECYDAGGTIDTGDWIDVRILYDWAMSDSLDMEIVWKSRGTYDFKSEYTPVPQISIGYTPKTEGVTFLIGSLPTTPQFADPDTVGTLVEFEARLGRIGKTIWLDIVSWRKLQPGETIFSKHYPKYFRSRYH